MIVGLDIGGANLKAATVAGPAVSRRFALYRAPERLADELHALLAGFPAVTGLAVTMTGELCDCYATKREGVHSILDAVESLGLPTRVYLTDGRLVSIAEARRDPLLAAASNWLALATVAARLAGPGPGLLLDIGSTTTDVIPLLDGVPRPLGRTDRERLGARELVYSGVRRTPLCAVFGGSLAAEFFATMHDAYLILGQAAPDPEDTDTADGRPATVAAAHARLARMVLADTETMAEDDCYRLAQTAASHQRTLIADAIDVNVARLPSKPQTVVIAGSGAFLAREMALFPGTDLALARLLDLGEAWDPDRSTAACAYALALLAEEEPA